MSPCPCLHVSMSMSPCSCFHVSGILQMETRFTKNGNFHFFAANGNGNSKLLFVCCKRKQKKGNLFSLVGKWQIVIDVCCIRKYVLVQDNRNLDVLGLLHVRRSNTGLGKSGLLYKLGRFGITSISSGMKVIGLLYRNLVRYCSTAHYKQLRMRIYIVHCIHRWVVLALNMLTGRRRATCRRTWLGRRPQGPTPPPSTRGAS